MAAWSLLGAGGGVILLGYVSKSIASDKLQEYKLMVETATSHVSDVLKELSEGRTKSKVVEFYGRTWTPPSQRIIDRNGDHQIVIQDQQHEVIEECKWNQNKWNCYQIKQLIATMTRVNELYLVDLAWQEPVDTQEFEREIKSNSILVKSWEDHLLLRSYHHFT